MGNFWLPPTPMRISQRWELGLGPLSKTPLFSGWQLPPCLADPMLPAPPRPLTCFPSVPLSGAFLLRFAASAWRHARASASQGLLAWPHALRQAESMWEEWRSEFSPQSRGLRRGSQWGLQDTVVGAGATVLGPSGNQQHTTKKSWRPGQDGAWGPLALREGF